MDEEKRLVKKKEVKVPTLAEFKLSRSELKRLTKIGVSLKKRLNVGKAGITEGIVNGIHERWRHAEVVKIRCEDICKLNMKRTHDLLETKTGGLVVWRSGSTIILYRGANYTYPYFIANVDEKNDNLDNASLESTIDNGIGGDNDLDNASLESTIDNGIDGERHNKRITTNSVQAGSSNHPNMVARSSIIHGVGSPNRVRFQLPGEAQLAQEADALLEGLGPRFTDWWGYDPVPVDADLLPAIVPGYRRPFRLLPYGIKPKLTDDEMTTIRRLSRPLPCHFALGRNRRLHGLAVSMVKLWEKSEIAKIAVKRGAQNTNSDMMAEELKWLTGGTLISRDREFIVFYRGKDFLPAAVSTAIEERKKHVVHTEKQLKEEKSSIETMPQVELRTEQVACDDEVEDKFQRNWDLVAEQKKTKLASSRIKKINAKLSMALEKKEKAEKILADLENAAEPLESEVDKEGITEEERYMLKKVGLRMKAYLPLGRRGVFDGTVENMHLHWKYRELVKIMASARSIDDIHATARTLEAESGGILIAVERVNREFAIIVYRGKNYQRPVDLRPRTLLNKRQALKRSLEAQRRESLKLHVLKLTKNIDQLKLQLVKDDTKVSGPQPDEDSESETSDGGGLVKYSHSEKDASSAESTDDQESHSWPDGSSYSEETIQLHKLMDTSSKYVGPEEPKSSSETKFIGSHLNTLQSESVSSDDSASLSSTVDSLTQAQATCSISDNAEIHVSSEELLESQLELKDLYPAANRDIRASNEVVPLKATPLSNRDRLLLRKQALKMGKRPVLAIGRNNIVTGVAKTIKTHFKKHPLAIVNVKGRAEGTSIQEVVFMLEQATGAVLVSQETNIVILYRGWGMEEGKGGVNNKRNKQTIMTGRERKTPEVVSPQLMDAIRVECGLPINQEGGTL